jgi:hypothetical protein
MVRLVVCLPKKNKCGFNGMWFYGKPGMWFCGVGRAEIPGKMCNLFVKMWFFQNVALLLSC